MDLCFGEGTCAGIDEREGMGWEGGLNLFVRCEGWADCTMDGGIV